MNGNGCIYVCIRRKERVYIEWPELGRFIGEGDLMRRPIGDKSIVFGLVTRSPVPYIHRS